MKSGCFVPSAGIAVGGSRKFTPARCEMVTPLLSGSTNDNLGMKGTVIVFP